MTFLHASITAFFQDNASIRIGSIDCPVATPQQSAGGPAGTVDRNRSQDRPASASNNHGIQLEKTLAKKELILKSNETQTRTKITSTKHKVKFDVFRWSLLGQVLVPVGFLITNKFDKTDIIYLFADFR